MFEEANNFADIFRGGIPYYLLLALPILIICSSNPVLASEFTVQRMSQYDVNGVAYGCRASALSLEAKSLYTWSTNRHCVVAKLQDITIDQFNEIRQKAGGLVALLPKDVSQLSLEDRDQLNLLEQAMLTQPSSIPIYFSHFNAELEQVIKDITRTSAGTDKLASNRRGNAASELFSSISANGYQVIVSGGSHNQNKQSKIAVIQGELAPLHYKIKQIENDPDSSLPLIIITGHLNTIGLYNEHPLNADTAVLLTLIELFSKLHHAPNTAPKYRLLFLLSETGEILNFQGTKRWLDENVQLQNVEFVLCLDTITRALNSESDSALYMHVSKPPKEGTAMSNFFKLLKQVALQRGNITIDGVHKKINLADQQLAWEHERFSMKRLPAFTLSALKTPKEPVRNTIFTDDMTQIVSQTQRNSKIIAEALAHLVYNIPNSVDKNSVSTNTDNNIFVGATEINEGMIKSYLNVKSALYNNDLKNSFDKYLKNVKLIFDKPDTRDPDFMLYDGHDAKLNVYRVKPAVFDLFLTMVICLYLTSVYAVIQYFPKVYDTMYNMSKAQLQTPNGNNNYSHANSNNASERSKLKSY